MPQRVPRGEQAVEGRGVDLGAFKPGPGVVVGVGGVDATHEIAGGAFFLQPVERSNGDDGDAAEIENHGGDIPAMPCGGREDQANLIASFGTRGAGDDGRCRLAHRRRDRHAVENKTAIITGPVRHWPRRLSCLARRAPVL